MNFLTAARAALLLSAATASGEDRRNHPHLTGSMPPDPVTVNRVEGSVTVASLAIRQIMLPNSDFLWEMLETTEKLSTPQLRTLAFDLLRIRRFYDQDNPQEWLVISAWMDRDPVATVRELMNIPDWEDRDDNIGDYDSDAEFSAALFWKQLARQDFPAALEIAGKLEGKESIRQFFGLLSDARFSPQEAADLVKLDAVHEPLVKAAHFAKSCAGDLYVRSGTRAAEAFIKLLPEGRIREAAAFTLQEMEREAAAHPKKSTPPASPPEMSAALARLASMDVQGRNDPFPFPLRREVRALPAGDAVKLLEEWRRVNPVPAGWLGWLLGKTLQARGIGTPGTQPPAYPPTDWISYGLGRDTPDTIAIRKIAKLAADGNYPAAIAAADSFRLRPEAVNQLHNPLAEVLLIMALLDFPTAMANAREQKDASRRRVCISALDKAMHRLPCAAVLPHLDPSLAAELYIDPWWPFLPFEDREAGFRYFEKHADILKGEAEGFLRTSVRFETARAIALAREKNLDLTNIAAGLAMHRPDRINEFLKPGDGKRVWEAVARSLAEYHPEKVIAVLKTQPFAEAWNMAGSRLAYSRPDLMKEITPHMSADTDSEDPFR